mmetsp:Transcript_570/g.1617  ORF Transcript_570/g.1617 Transcript_570/m.1617 type:complete len:214 (-) Transcript_570:637-1278(-)
MIQEGRQDNGTRRCQSLQDAVAVFDGQGHQQSTRGTQQREQHREEGPTAEDSGLAARLASDEEDVNGEAAQRELEVAFPDVQLERIRFDDLLEVDGCESAERYLDEHRRSSDELIRAVGNLMVVRIAPDGFREEQDAEHEGYQRPPLRPGILASQDDGGKRGCCHDLALSENGEHTSRDIAQGDEGEDIHGAVDAGKDDHLLGCGDQVLDPIR